MNCTVLSCDPVTDGSSAGTLLLLVRRTLAATLARSFGQWLPSELADLLLQWRCGSKRKRN